MVAQLCADAEGLFYVEKAQRQDAYACKVPVCTAVLKHLINFLPVVEGGTEYTVHWTQAEFDDNFLFALVRSLQKYHFLQSELCAAAMHRYPPAGSPPIDLDTSKNISGSPAHSLMSALSN